jgi:hypothetical protein
LEHAAATAGMQPWPKGDVRRRFNDFVSLADLLTETHRGYFLHPRPDKGALEAAAAGRSEAEFVEMRRAELERYLRQLVAHPIAGRSEELRVFLIAEGSLATSFEWRQLLPLRGSLAEGVARLPRQLLGSDSSIPTTTDVTKNPRHTNDLMRRFRELGERMRQEYQAPRDLPPDEVVLRVRSCAWLLNPNLRQPCFKICILISQSIASAPSILLIFFVDSHFFIFT